MADRPDHVGQQLGNYRLIRLLGEGGFAEVYLGEHIYLKTQVAVKVLQEKIEAQYVEEFLKEAQMIAALKHPHILRVLDFGMENTRPFLVMEYASGGTLRQKHPRGSKVPLPTVISYAKQVTMALQYAHGQKIVHRDVKPENMLVEADDKIVLGDFGIAIPAHKTQSLSTQEAVGTVAYMAPEQIQGKPRAASDQYSLGIVIYEWLSGARPFEGATAIEIAMHHLTDPPLPLREKVPTIAAEVEQVVMTALAKDPKQRFATVQAFATALEQASQSGQNQPSLSSVEVTRASQPSSPTVPATPPNPSSPEPIVVPANYSSALEQANQPEQKQPSTPLPEATQSNHPTILITPPNIPNPSIKPATNDPPLSYVFDAPKEPDTQQLMHQPTRYPSRRTVIAGLAGLALASSGITWFAVLHSSTSKPARQHPVTPTQRPTPPSGRIVFTYEGPGAGGSTLAWSPDGKRIASTDDRTLLVWDALTGKNVVSLQDQKSFTIMAIAWSPDGKSIAAGGNYPNGDVQIWDAVTGKVIQKPQARIDTIWSITWSPDSKYLAAGGFLHVVDVWNARTGERLYTDTNYTGGSYTGRGHGIDWSPDGKWLASASEDSTLQLWDPLTGANRTTYHFTNFVNDVAWSPDGRKIALTNLNKANNTLQGSIDILDVASGQTLHTQTFSPSRIGSFSWSPDGKYIANASSTDDGRDQTVHVWDVTTGKVWYIYTGISTSYVEFAVVWSPISNYIAFADGDKICIWEVP